MRTTFESNHEAVHLNWEKTEVSCDDLSSSALVFITSIVKINQLVRQI